MLPARVTVDCDPLLLARLGIISDGRIIAGFAGPGTCAVLCQCVRLVGTLRGLTVVGCIAVSTILNTSSWKETTISLLSEGQVLGRREWLCGEKDTMLDMDTFI